VTTTTFDTHKFVRRLKEAGLPEMQAEALTDALRDAQGEADLATKQDITELKRDIQSLEIRFDAELRTRIKEIEATLLKWVVGLLIAQTAVLIAAARIIVHG
jgi:hypothetical protein